MNKKIIIYAPNVRSGGGVVLLQALLDDAKRQRSIVAIVDVRAKEVLKISPVVDYVWVTPGFVGRLKAELRLKTLGGPNDGILCFHGLPPLFVRGREVVVFVQNRLMFSAAGIKRMSARTRLRTLLERMIAIICRRYVTRYVVQTPSMARVLCHWHRGKPDVRIAPFTSQTVARQSHESGGVRWDFVYVANGEAHKNHDVLLKAWKLLADQGVKPTLALTLGPSDSALWRRIEQECPLRGLFITNLGQMRHEEILELYGNSSSLIFPSLYESFGLPLVEASRMGLPIVASELDFVRDVCNPAQTFDPNSEVSIARAVKRFLGKHDAGMFIQDGGGWLDDIFKREKATSQA